MLWPAQNQTQNQRPVVAQLVWQARPTLTTQGCAWGWVKGRGRRDVAGGGGRGRGCKLKNKVQCGAWWSRREKMSTDGEGLPEPQARRHIQASTGRSSHRALHVACHAFLPTSCCRRPSRVLPAATPPSTAVISATATAHSSPSPQRPSLLPSVCAVRVRALMTPPAAAFTDTPALHPPDRFLSSSSPRCSTPHSQSDNIIPLKLLILHSSLRGTAQSPICVARVAANFASYCIRSLPTTHQAFPVY